MKEILTEGVAQLGLKMSPFQRDTLLGYVELVRKWNKVFNLTALEDYEQILTHHILDSLSVIPYLSVLPDLSGVRVLDVGSGAGLPGIPLAIMLPGSRFVLLDSNGKKTRFMQQSVLELGLNNVEVVKSRLQEYLPEQSFDTVISRAFSSIIELLRSCAHICTPDSQILAMKGRYPAQELHSLGTAMEPDSVSVQKIKVPGLNAERHLVRLKGHNILKKL